ncbi:hypothetical protein BC828DRAFT_419035 [Blastocladiella britannica]|nr:hypothetical protein BC828DRAFT_419035 [Blastocladiella britannica]
MENIPLILDRILLFASHKVYTLTAGLGFLQVLPHTELPDTRRHIVCRLVDVSDLGFIGRLDLLWLLAEPLTAKIIGHIAHSAAIAGHTHVLEWLLIGRPMLDPKFLTRTLHNIVYLAAMHGRTHVLDWCAAHGAVIRSGFKDPFNVATQYCRLDSLKWLKAYSVEHGIDYEFRAIHREIGLKFVPGKQRVAVLDWWKAEYTSRPEPMFSATGVGFPSKLAVYTDDGLLVVDWWRTYCAEMGREFTWPVLSAISLLSLAMTGSLSMCQWWWDETVQQIGIQETKLLLPGVLDIICESGRPDYLDWYWSTCADSGGEIEFPRDWRPQVPFTHLNVIQWWDTKVEAGQVDPDVFDIVLQEPLTKLDMILSRSGGAVIQLQALDWWMQRFGVEPRLSPATLSRLANSHNLDLMKWYLDRCTPESPLPALTFGTATSMVSTGRLDMVEQIWQLSVTYNRLLTLDQFEIKILQIDQRIASSAVLDYLWDFCTRIGVRFEPGYNSKSTILAMEANDLDSIKWWYAMHRVHSTAFPSAEELGRVDCAPDSVVARWIRSIQI